jgi:polysaccharide biosynthesis protein PelG
MTNSDTTIEAMTRRGTLSGVLGAYLYAAFLVAGPWIFTVLGLLGLGACLLNPGAMGFEAQA